MRPSLPPFAPHPRRAPRWLLAVSVPLLAGLACASDPGIGREQALQQVGALGNLDERLAQAEAEGLALLAPAGVAAAQERFDQAIGAAERGALDEARRLATEGSERLEKAQSDSRRSAEILREVLEKREQAVAADAAALKADRFEALEARVREAARRVEGGNIQAAKEAVPALLEGYSSLELAALKTDATELAKQALRQAEEADAERYAGKTYERAEKELGIAVGILEADRSQVAQANVHSRRASEIAAQSQFISELVQEFERRDYDREDILLWYQEQLRELATPLAGTLSFSEPNHELIAGLRSDIASTVEGQREAEAQLTAARLRIDALEASASDTIASISESEARYTRVQGLFSEEEATVYRQGQDLRLETYGFSFPVGGSEIGSENFPLLNKISEAIEEFDSPRVVVTGHTDSTGSNEVNQRLSEDRARKVGDFLVEVGRLDAARVATQGFGESRPVASNETDDGRARNRRIEILILNDPGSGSLPAVSAPPAED